MLRILSIDPSRDEFGWSWNNWFEVKQLPKETFLGLKSNRALLKLFRELGLLSEASKGRCAVEDDGYNVVITLKSTGCPLYAIEYGHELS